MLKTLLGKLPRIELRSIAAALVAIGILHIVVTLLVPSLTRQNGYDVMVRDLPLNSMQVLSPITARTQPLPFFAPDARYAVCRFDATDGAVAINATLPGPGWVLALFSPEGDNFFTTVAGAGRAKDVSLLLVPGEEVSLPDRDRLLVPAQQPDRMLKVMADRGLALLRAPDQGDAYRMRNLAALKQARCAFRAL